MTMITPSYLGETIEYSSLHACRSTLEDPTEPLRCAIIDADRSEDDVAAAIWSTVESRLHPAGVLKAKLA